MFEVSTFTLPKGMYGEVEKLKQDKSNGITKIQVEEQNRNISVTLEGNRKNVRECRRELFKMRHGFPEENTIVQPQTVQKPNGWANIVKSKEPIQTGRKSPYQNNGRKSPYQNNGRKSPYQNKGRKSPNTKPHYSISKERQEELSQYLWDLLGDNEKDYVDIYNLNSKEREFLHLECSKPSFVDDIGSKSHGDHQNRLIRLYKIQLYISDERKNELTKIVKDFDNSEKDELYYDIYSEAELKFIEKISESFDMVFNNQVKPVKKTVVKKKGEVCWHWLKGTCRHQNNPELCNYEHKKTQVCKFWEQGRCRFQNEPEKCCNLHEYPENEKEKDIEEDYKFNTWIKLPSNILMTKEEWYNYVDGVIKGHTECREKIEIFIEKIVGWDEPEDCDTKLWSSIIPLTEPFKSIIENPLYSYLLNNL